jgi:NADH-quinone oxidoreductase subunit C
LGRADELAATLARLFGDGLIAIPGRPFDLTYELRADRLLEVGKELRDAPELRFEMCMDVCGVDFLQHGLAEWKTFAATATGFSRGVSRAGASSEDIDGSIPQAPPATTEAPPATTEALPGADLAAPGARRFAVVYHLLSVSLNQRLRLRVYCPDDDEPIVDSVCDIWASADWFERETFDLFGILFRGHPDLRRLLTDYGFIGHPFRKDFPLSGNVEVRYDPEKGRVVYQPVTIDPRILVPKVIRRDNRYDPQLTNADLAPPAGKPNA